MEPNTTRRDAIRLGGGVVGLAATGSLAGCGALPFFGGPPGYTKWIYDPETIGDRTRLTYRRGNFNQLRRNEEDLGGAYNSYQAAQQEWPLVTLNLQFGQVGQGFQIAPQSGRVTGDFEANIVGNALTNKNFEEDGTHGGYTVYTKSGRAVAVDNGDAVYCDDSQFAQDVEPRMFLETVIDAKNGETDRYVDESEAFTTLTTRLGDATFVVGGTQEPPSETAAENGQFEDAVASGLTVAVNGETSKVRAVVVFKEKDDVDMEAIGTWADSDRFDSLEDPSTNQRGNAALVTGKAPTTDLDLPSVF